VSSGFFEGVSTLSWRPRRHARSHWRLPSKVNLITFKSDVNRSTHLSFYKYYCEKLKESHSFSAGPRPLSEIINITCSADCRISYKPFLIHMSHWNRPSWLWCRILQVDIDIYDMCYFRSDVREVFDLFDFWDGRDGLVDGFKVGDFLRCCGLNPTNAIVLANGGTTKLG